MARLIWTEPALADLNEIADYIALDNFAAAQNLVQKIFSWVERLEQFPESGRKPPEIRNTQYRELIIGPCRVFYRIEQHNVFLLYVMRSERELRNYIIEDRAQNIS
ncbi:MAG: type II toxin-antitoxin system RelE/ParE family toxin [Gammaproteobacteria bacterium]|nr:type II toxin-antitoxin system RelE/ParE family toxin [Gammaproteobacteria bacterium]